MPQNVTFHISYGINCVPAHWSGKKCVPCTCSRHSMQSAFPRHVSLVRQDFLSIWGMRTTAETSGSTAGTKIISDVGASCYMLVCAVLLQQ